MTTVLLQFVLPPLQVHHRRRRRRRRRRHPSGRNSP